MKNKLFFLFILIAACSKNSSHHSIAVPDLIQAEKTRANITGRIYLYDGENNPITDNSGITVSIENSTVTTQTGVDGKWTLDSIPKGTYDISYSKPGYGTGKIMGIFHAATNHATTSLSMNEKMNEVSKIVISDIKTAPFTSEPTLGALISSGLYNNGLYIEPIFNNPSTKQKPIRLFFSDNSNVSSTNYIKTQIIYSSGKDEVKESLTFDTKWFQNNGFKLGQKIFIKAYGDGYKEDFYENPSAEFPIFPSLAATGSPVISVAIPEK